MAAFVQGGSKACACAGLLLLELARLPGEPAIVCARAS